MKTLSCKELGGVCDTKISANEPGEMDAKWSIHMTDSHPELHRERMNKLETETKEEGLARYNKSIARWKATPDSKQPAPITYDIH